MKFISITKSINIRPDWATIGAKLKAGTPLDITGAVANSSAAVGILADDAEKSTAEVAVVTEGSIDLAEITASYGELEDDCIAAIKGISFIDADGNPIVPSGGGLPDYSTADSGSVLTLYGPYPNCFPVWLPPQSGGGVTTLYFDRGSVYETSDFWTDPTMSDPSALVTFADAVAMVQANPASVLFQSNANGAMPAHAMSDGYGIYITMLTFPQQNGMAVYGYRFLADPSENTEATIMLSEGS